MARKEQPKFPGRYAYVRPLDPDPTDETIDEMVDAVMAGISGELPVGTHQSDRTEVMVGSVSPAFITWRTSVQSSNARAAAKSARSSVDEIEELMGTADVTALSTGKRGALTRAVNRARAALAAANAASDTATKELEGAAQRCNHPSGDELSRLASGYHSRAWDAKEEAYRHEKAAARALQTVKTILGHTT